MTPKSTSLFLFTAMSTLSTAAYACGSMMSPMDEFLWSASVGTMVAVPYALTTSLLFLALRNRWLEGSWKRWIKHSAVAYLVAHAGWVVGSAISISAGLEGKAVAVVLLTTPLVFLSGHIALLKSRARKQV